MTLDWDRNALRDLAMSAARQVAGQALPVLREHVAGKFDLRLVGSDVVADYAGLVAEYGDGTGPNKPWVFGGIIAVKEAIGGDQQGG